MYLQQAVLDHPCHHPSYMLDLNDMKTVIEQLKDLKSLTQEDFVNLEYGTAEEWTSLQDAPSGRIVIRIIEGGNEYMKVGQSLSGTTPFLCIGFPVLVEYPKGYYKSTAVESINWEQGTFRTKCSTYSFHFCK